RRPLPRRGSRRIRCQLAQQSHRGHPPPAANLAATGRLDVTWDVARAARHRRAFWWTLRDGPRACPWHHGLRRTARSPRRLCRRRRSLSVAAVEISYAYDHGQRRPDRTSRGCATLTECSASAEEVSTVAGCRY